MREPRPVRVFIVDDQEPFRRAATAVVNLTESFVVVGTAGSGEECLTVVPDLRPDLVLIDVNLPGLDGIDTAALLSARPAPPVVALLSTYPEAEYADRARDCGAVAYLDKSAFGPDSLTELWARTVAATGSVTRISTRRPPDSSTSPGPSSS